VDAVSDLELGRPEELCVGLGGEEFGDAPDLVPDDGEQAPFSPVGLVAPDRGRGGHERAFREGTARRSGRRIDALCCTISRPGGSESRSFTHPEINVPDRRPSAEF